MIRACFTGTDFSNYKIFNMEVPWLSADGHHTNKNQL
jgi:hypothetical protein